MKRLLKWLAAVVGVIVLLLVSAAILLPLLIDPNDHKQALVDQVKARTGRDLNIAGDIELSVFPWLGVELGKTSLSNAAGFSAPVFASTDKVAIRVKLLPLLSKRLEMDTVTVQGLRLNLARDASGRTNWDDLVKAGGAEPPGAPGSKGDSDTSDGTAAVALAVGGVDIRDANLSWDDATQNQHYEISNLSVQTGALTPGEPVDLALALDLQAGDPAISGHITAAGRLDYDTGAKIARVDGLEVEGTFAGPQLPQGKARVALAANVTHDAGKQTLVVEKLALEAEELKLNGELRVSDINSAPTTKGNIRIEEFNPKKLLAALSKEPFQTADPKALTRVSLDATIGGRPNQLVVKPLTVRLDDSTLKGELSIADIKSQALRFDLALDAIDADRYMPPEKDKSEASTPVAASPGAAAGGAGQVPNETLRRLDVVGRVNIGKLKAAKLNMSDVDMSVTAKDGLIRLNPIGANLYNGNYRGNITVDARGDTPRISVDENLAGILAGPLLKDLQGTDRLTGMGNVNVAMQTAGVTPDEITKSLNGSASFAFTDGAINGVNIARMIREAHARIKGIKLPPAEVEQKTDFSELRGSMRVTNGVATNEDFVAMTPLLRINGKGTANLPAESLDYRIQATLVKSLEGQGGQNLDELVGIPIPIRVTGSFAEPKYALDTEALAQSLAKGKAKELIEEKVGEKIGEKIGDDKVKGLLKGLIK